jgi:predicted DCC family thiol-disulfide oxidoreductase YuxK
MITRIPVFFDGACSLCRKSVQLLRRLDWGKHLDYVDVRHAADQRVLRLSVPPTVLLEQMHVQKPNGVLLKGFAALRYLARWLPALWPVLPLLYLPGVGAVGQRLYLWVARNRFHLVPCHGGVCSLK